MKIRSVYHTKPLYCTGDLVPKLYLSYTGILFEPDIFKVDFVRYPVQIFIFKVDFRKDRENLHKSYNFGLF